MPSDSYWAVGRRAALACDLGHKCRECGKAFTVLGEMMILRRGGRIEMRYHVPCFSGEADPRTQPGSSFHVSEHANIAEHAPTGKYRKMRTSSQF